MSMGSMPWDSTAATCSGNPVNSLMSFTVSPASRRAFEVPPVETSSTPCPARARANSTRPALSVTERRARRTGRRSTETAAGALCDVITFYFIRQSSLQPTPDATLHRVVLSGAHKRVVEEPPPFFAGSQRSIPSTLYPCAVILSGAQRSRRTCIWLKMPHMPGAHLRREAPKVGNRAKRDPPYKTADPVKDPTRSTWWPAHHFRKPFAIFSTARGSA